LFAASPESLTVENASFFPVEIAGLRCRLAGVVSRDGTAKAPVSESELLALPDFLLGLLRPSSSARFWIAPSWRFRKVFSADIIVA
jgi:hypothetical protein